MQAIGEVLIVVALSTGPGAGAIDRERPPGSAIETISAVLRARDPGALADTTLPRLAGLDREDRAALAESLAGRPVGERVAAWAFLQVGAPYRLGSLGEEAPPDEDPVIAFEATDCAVLNLTSAALAHVRDAGSERAAMAIANYRDGALAYTTRFHFTTDRLDASPYYRDVTKRIGGRACTMRVVTLNRKANGGRWIPIDWSRRREVVYLPRVHALRFERDFAAGRIPAALGVACVRESTLGDGLDVVHETMLWQGRTLLHASSKAGRVTTVPWTEFLAGPGRGYDGFVLFEYR